MTQATTTIPRYRNIDWETWESTPENRAGLAAALLGDRLGRGSPMVLEYMQNRLRDAITAYTALGHSQAARGIGTPQRTRLQTFLEGVMSGTASPEASAREAQTYFGRGLGTDEYTQRWNAYLGGNEQDPYTAMRLMSMIRGWAPEYTSQATYEAPQQRQAWRNQPAPPYGVPFTPYLPWLLQRFAPQQGPRG